MSRLATLWPNAAAQPTSRSVSTGASSNAVSAPGAAQVRVGDFPLMWIASGWQYADRYHAVALSCAITFTSIRVHL